MIRSISFALSNDVPEIWRPAVKAHRCDLCDMKKATKYRIPACKRPAAYWTWIVMFNFIHRFHVCRYHHRKYLQALNRP